MILLSIIKNMSLTGNWIKTELMRAGNFSLFFREKIIRKFSKNINYQKKAGRTSGKGDSSAFQKKEFSGDDTAG